MNTRIVSIGFSALISLFTASQPSQALVPTSTGVRLSEVDNLSSALLAKEIELLKLNTRLKLYLLPRNPWSARRQSGIGFTNATLTAVGAFTNGIGRFHYLNSPKKAPSPLFENAGIVRFLANSITAGAQVVEFCNDTITDIKDRRQGVSLSIMRKRANVLAKEIDELLEKRHAVALAERDSYSVFAKEESVLRDLRDLAANEFAIYYSDARGNRFSRRLGYLISFTSNFASGAGTLVGIEAAHLHGLKSVRRNHMGGVGGITDIVTGSINVLAPFAIKGGQVLQTRLTRNRICEELSCKQMENLDSFLSHQRECAQAIARESELDVHGLVLRQPALNAASEILQKRYSMLDSERVNARKRFYENVAVATIAGASKITNGIGGTVGGFKYAKDAYHRFELQGATAISYGTGNALAALETARFRLTDEFKMLESQKAKTGKRDILNRQLKQLDELQSAPQFASNPIIPTM
ncbi:MAG: hypothetical protein K2X27_02135 [Candidatus Obscuribacterales bacterium]|nr:hypothetical protein [Candidatus Obscuribacterales bacterium]